MGSRTLVLATVTLLGFGTQAFAWGERGHHTVCEVAAKLVTNNEKTGAFARWMLPKGHMMGHVCNLPDISWRSMKTPEGEENTLIDPRVGDEAHFINPESFGYKNADGSPNTIGVKLNYGEMEKEADTFKKGKQSAHQVMGSNWWRTQQLYSLAVDSGKAGLEGIKEVIRLEKAFDRDFKRLKKAEKEARAEEIAARKEEVIAKKDEINKNLRKMLIAMGVMGHFVGDAGQPFHNSSDYNGKESGHYGIHSYYESKLVDQIGSDIQGLVFDSASKDLANENSALRQILATTDPDPAYSGDPYNVVARMRSLSALAGVQMKDILAAEESIVGFQKGELHKAKDPVGRPFADALAADARQNPADWKLFKATEQDKVHPYNKLTGMIVNEMGVAAKLLATFWDGIYEILDKRAKEISAEIAAAEGPGAKVQHIELTKYYTTWDYPLDSPYIPTTYMVVNKGDQSGPSLTPMKGQYMPPPDVVKQIPFLRQGDELPITTQLGEFDGDGHHNKSAQ